MKKTLMMHRQKSFSDRERMLLILDSGESLASSLTVGPNMDRKLNKNWDDVSTETVETACSYENLYTLAKEEKEIRFQNFYTMTTLGLHCRTELI